MENLRQLELDYVKRVSLEHRKKYAQFFTPQEVASVMAGWILQAPNLKSVLEPAFGLGIFSRILLSFKDNLKIKGFEVDETIFECAKTAFSGSSNVSLLLQDYMHNDWENKYDGIICNPPYFKFHDYDNKNIIKEIEQRLSCKLNGFTNFYTLFLLKSIYQLNDGGRCAYIIPSEFMNSDYGKLVKYHLIKTRTLRHIIVFDFEENVFDDAVTTACIVLCAKDRDADRVQFINLRNKNELRILHQFLCGDLPSLEPPGIMVKTLQLSKLDAEVKWKSYYQEPYHQRYKNLVPFSKYAKVTRGIATGANDFFTFTMDKAQSHGIDEKYLLPCICKCADVRVPIFRHEHFLELRSQNKKVFLINAVNVKDRNVVQYIEGGKAQGIDKKYLTSSRNPWYALEKRVPAPIWVSVFNRNGLRFVRNEANVFNLTTFHCIYPQFSLFSNLSIDLLFAYLLTETAKRIFEDNAREYGNGLQKFEPNDLNKGQMLDLALLPDDIKEMIEFDYRRFRQSGDKTFINGIDSVIKSFFYNHSYLHSNGVN